MKITKSQLKQIIKEELSKLSEMEFRDLMSPEEWKRLGPAKFGTELPDTPPEEEEEEREKPKMLDRWRLNKVRNKIRKRMNDPSAGKYYDTYQGGSEGVAANRLKRLLQQSFPDPDEMLSLARQLDPYGWS